MHPLTGTSPLPDPVPVASGCRSRHVRRPIRHPERERGISGCGSDAQRPIRNPERRGRWGRGAAGWDRRRECPATVADRSVARPARQTCPDHPSDRVRTPLSTTTSSTLVPEGLTTSPSEMGTFNEEGEYTPRQITSNDVGSFADYIDDTHGHRRGRPARRGQGRPHRQGRGPARHRLQVRGRGPQPRAEHPQRRRPVRGRQPGRHDRGPRPHQGGQGRPPDPVQEAGPVRAGLGQDRGDQGERGRRHRPGHRGRQGRAHHRHRPARLPARQPRRAPPGPRPGAVRRSPARGQDHRARQEPQQRRAVPPGLARGDPARAARGLPRRTSSRARSAAASCPASSTSAPSSTSAAWTDSSTCPSCPGSTSTTPAPSSPSATRSRSRCSRSTTTASASRLSLKATQQDPWQEFAGAHQVGELVYGRVTKLVPFGAFVQVGEGIEGLVHISEMSAHHVDLPEQVVTPGEELWVKIIDLDLQRRRISLSIKQAAEGGVVAAEYQDAFGEQMYDDEGNYIGPEVEEIPSRGRCRRVDERRRPTPRRSRPRRPPRRRRARRRRRRRGADERRRSRPRRRARTDSLQIAGRAADAAEDAPESDDS